jgi:hypothetical protein
VQDSVNYKCLQLHGLAPYRPNIKEPSCKVVVMFPVISNVWFSLNRGDGRIAIAFHASGVRVVWCVVVGLLEANQMTVGQGTNSLAQCM